MRTVNRLRATLVGRMLPILSVCATLTGAAACAGFSSERLVYDQGGARIGIEADPSVARSKMEIRNAHPALLTEEDVRSLLGVVQVSGWSGTFAGIFESPRPVPLLSAEEMTRYASKLSEAIHLAGPVERVFFSFPKPGVTYSEDRTAGSMFMRGRYLHLVVTDHASVIQADTGGGDMKDIRDTKGMKLWVTKPAQAATVPDAEEPNWALFETVHISLNAKDILALRIAPSPTKIYRAGDLAPITVPSQAAPTRQSGTTPEDLQLQIRELTSSNLELRERLEEQTSQMKTLTEEMNRLRREIENAKTAKPSPRKPLSP